MFDSDCGTVEILSRWRNPTRCPGLGIAPPWGAGRRRPVAQGVALGCSYLRPVGASEHPAICYKQLHFRGLSRSVAKSPPGSESRPGGARELRLVAQGVALGSSYLRPVGASEPRRFVQSPGSFHFLAVGATEPPAVIQEMSRR